MDSFTMQKDLRPLFAPFCNLQSAHTISRRLWREVRISSRASTPEKICLHQFFNLLLLLAGDLPLMRYLKEEDDGDGHCYGHGRRSEQPVIEFTLMYTMAT